MSDTGRVKADPDNVVSLRVKDQAGGEVTFRVKRTTKFEKIIQAFCTRKVVDAQHVRFIYDGQRILPTQTPMDFDMENDDTIDAFLEQVGGC